MWSKLCRNMDKAIPDFNDELLIDFREKSINDSPAYISKMLKVTQDIVNEQFGEGCLEFKSYKVRSPKERVQYIANNPYVKVPVNPSNSIMVDFEFEFNGETKTIPMIIPFIVDHSINVHGTHYYPMFVVTERIWWKKDEFSVKVSRTILQFSKSKDIRYKSLEDVLPLVDKIPMVNAHNKKHKNTVPIILYDLCQRGLTGTDGSLVNYGFDLEENDISIVQKPEPHDDYLHFKINCGYIRVRSEFIYGGIDDSTNKDYSRRKYVSSLIYIFTKMRKPRNIQQLDEPNWYRSILGQAIFDKNSNAAKAANEATNHIDSLQSYIDPPSQKSLERLGRGRPFDDINDLFSYIFFVMDDKLTSYEPGNLYDKCISLMSELMNGITQEIHKEAYKLASSVNKANQPKRSLWTMPADKTKDIYKSGVFYSGSTTANDCWLWAAGVRRIRSLMGITGKQGKHGNMNIEECTVHPSAYIVNAALRVPAGAAISKGSINVYLETDKDGNIEIPEYSKILDPITAHKR